MLDHINYSNGNKWMLNTHSLCGVVVCSGAVQQ